MADVESAQNDVAEVDSQGVAGGGGLPVQNNATDPAAALAQLRSNVDHIMLQLNTNTSGIERSLLPVVVLFCLKFLVDNFVHVTLFVAAFVGLQKIGSRFAGQVALKDRCSGIGLCYILFLSLSLAVATITFSRSLGYTENILDRLLVSPARAGTDLSFFGTLWNCLITDMIVRLFTQSLKVIACLIVYLRRISMPILQNNCKLDCFANEIRKKCRLTMGSNISVGDTASTTTGRRHHELDSSSSPLLDRNLSAPISATGRGMIGAIEGGLARRQLNHPDLNNLQRIAFDNGDCEKGDLMNDDSTSDGHSDRDATDEYMLSIRLCSLLDVAMYCYRCALPIPLWSAYFGGSTVSNTSSVFAIIYLLTKVTDIGWKVSGLYKGLEYFVMQKLDFGHYSTPAECASHSSNDCPICFDSPRRPVTLQCNHIFCEICIVEWLEKGKSCPVCRKDVEFETNLYTSLKKEAIRPIGVGVLF